MQTAPELQLLVVAAIVGLVQMGWAVSAAIRQRGGMAWGIGARDEPRPLTGVAARLERAFANYLETFPIFAAVLVAAYLAGKLGPLTLWGAGIYVAARAVYAPLYASGVPVFRTVVWSIAMAGIGMIIAAFFV